MFAKGSRIKTPRHFIYNEYGIMKETQSRYCHQTIMWNIVKGKIGSLQRNCTKISEVCCRH